MTATVMHPCDNPEGILPPCAGTDLEAWFPGPGWSTTQQERICAACPLKEPCLEWALHHEGFGIWGGTGPTERKQIREERGIEFHAPETWVLPRGLVRSLRWDGDTMGDDEE